MIASMSGQIANRVSKKYGGRNHSMINQIFLLGVDLYSLQFL
jgi:hypothetical protein